MSADFIFIFHTHSEAHPHGRWAGTLRRGSWWVGPSARLCWICVWEWRQRWTICLAECGCAWCPFCLGVAALQMFWLFLALLCFWFSLVCLELEGLQVIHCETFEEVLVKALPRARSMKPCPLTYLRTNEILDLQHGVKKLKFPKTI